MIPHILIRTVPAITSPEVDVLWRRARDLHADWDHFDYRDLLDPADFPISSPYWPLCGHGAQRAGLVRLEALLNHGGIYIDSDVHLFKPLDPLLQPKAWAAREGEWIIPDAVLGAEPMHPAIARALELAIQRLRGTSGEPLSWQTDSGPWATGPGAITTVFPDRDDTTVFGPELFYGEYCDPRPTLQERLEAFIADPPADAYGVHLWHWSWR